MAAKIAASSSATSLDIEIISTDTCLISESLSIASVWSSYSETIVPPFPLGCLVPMSTFLGIRSGVSGGIDNCEKYTITSATTTVPTAPRLRTMLKENLCIKKWVRGVSMADDALGHKPWEAVIRPARVTWVSEGSIHTPERFRDARANARRRNTRPTEINAPCRSSRSSYRDALVFEREITLKTDGQTKRWSVQVPATDMSQEVVDMVLELQNLNAFFKEDSTDLDATLVSPDSHQKSELDPPSLVVSTSHSMLPVAYDTLDAAPLAMRRGKLLPPLSFAKPAEYDPYPGIPTPFLGSPSAYTPTFEYADSNVSLNLRDMLLNLRTQSASLQPQTPVAPIHKESLSEVDQIAPLRAPSPDRDSGSMLDERSCDPFSDVTDFPVANANSAVPDHKECVIQPSRTVVFLHPPSDSTVSERPASTLSSFVSPRGILKRCKSVRFASLPNKSVVVPIEPQQAPAPRRFVDPSLSPRYASPLRRGFVPKAQPPSSPVLTPSLEAAGRQRPTRPTARASISPIKQMAPRPSLSSRGGRHSLGNVAVSGKENQRIQARTSVLPKLAMDDKTVRRRASTMENVVGSSQNVDIQKSRMPVPLRNILTRFK